MISGRPITSAGSNKNKKDDSNNVKELIKKN